MSASSSFQQDPNQIKVLKSAKTKSGLPQAPSALEQSREESSAQGTSGQSPSAQTHLEQEVADEGKKEETRVPSAQTPSAVDAFGNSSTGKCRRRKSEIFHSFGDIGKTWSGGRGRGSCATQLQRIAEDFCGDIDPRHQRRHGVGRGRRSVGARNRTRIKVATNPELIALDQKYRQLKERYDFLQEQFTISRRLQKAALQLRDELVSKFQREFEELRAKVQMEFIFEQAQNKIMAEELVRQTRLLEHSELAQKADEELLRRLQSQCDELRVWRAEAKLELVEFEDHSQHAGGVSSAS
ncbi:hypothetical protein AXG93_265s1010 [Marchantia polymorpha subsp. ruderalis]|uniref:Uncharacterized protein n=1 Tax=Marchantia polymorpha subsp. ruderalis TaxID=1480154 RepID=A0A176WQZ3_MARPO|nr:hypothetical protein AXG93_265s1010 [Marchantia polymorpha subsp. ruderalis]